MSKFLINIVILCCVQLNILYVRGGGHNARRFKFLDELPFCGSESICKPYCHPINKPSDTCESGPNFIKHGIPYCLCEPLCNSFCESINTICEEPNQNENSCITIASQLLLHINDVTSYFIIQDHVSKQVLQCSYCKAQNKKCCNVGPDNYECKNNCSQTK